jgi:hypothetical protein
MVGESSVENIRRIRVVQRVFLEPLHKREHHPKERKNEKKSTLLEFLEGCLSGMVNKISWKIFQISWSPAWNFASGDI